MTKFLEDSFFNKKKGFVEAQYEFSISKKRDARVLIIQNGNVSYSADSVPACGKQEEESPCRRG